MVYLERASITLKEVTVNTMTSEQLLTVKEVAQQLQMSEEAVRRLLRSKQIRGYFVSNTWRTKQEFIDEYLERQLNTNQQNTQTE